jgi:hypothetical protein
MEYPINQTSCSRAKQDTDTWLLNHIVAWFLAFLLPGGGTMVATFFIPPNADIRIAALYGFLGGLAGLLLLVVGVYVWNLIRAPYKQRNEARALLLGKSKSVPLQNKTELIRAIGRIRQKSLDLMISQEQLNQDRSPYSMDSNSISNRDKEYEEFKQAMNDLYSEMLVAGEPFKSTVEKLTTFIGFQVWGNITTPIQISYDKPVVLSGLDFAARLGETVDKTIREINDIVR